MKMKKRWLFALIGGVAISGVFLLSNDASFDKQVWQSYKGNVRAAYDNPRLDMADYLVESYLKAGMTENEIYELLGEADQVNFFSPQFTSQPLEQYGKCPINSSDKTKLDKGAYKCTGLFYNEEVSKRVSFMTGVRGFDGCVLDLFFDTEQKLFEFEHTCP